MPIVGDGVAARVRVGGSDPVELNDGFFLVVVLELFLPVVMGGESCGVEIFGDDGGVFVSPRVFCIGESAACGPEPFCVCWESAAYPVGIGVGGVPADRDDGVVCLPVGEVGAVPVSKVISIVAVVLDVVFLPLWFCFDKCLELLICDGVDVHIECVQRDGCLVHLEGAGGDLDGVLCHHESVFSCLPSRSPRSARWAACWSASKGVALARSVQSSVLASCHPVCQACSASCGCALAL